ncbi:MAG: amidohydrolase family protein [Acidobacteria bacterium]|nr:amidohydrolase family protein [Acidobacteriota bacterium]
MTTSCRLPLLRDHHNHPSTYAAMNGCLDIRHITDKRRAIELIREREDPLVFVLGWNNSLYRFDAAELERMPPVFICNHALHEFLINKGAEQLLGDRYLEVIANVGDGGWVQRNIAKILGLIVTVRGCDSQALSEFYRGILELGVWSAEDMLLPSGDTANTFANSGLWHRTRLWADPDVYLSMSDSSRDLVHGIKLFADGALAAQTAALTVPYLSGKREFLFRTDDQLMELLERIGDFGKPVAIHAVGDCASQQVIRVAGRARRQLSSCPAIRMEHCPFLDRVQALEAKDLGITLSMQPNFSSESVDYRDRLSEDLCAVNQPFRMLIDRAGFVPGEDLLFGSDEMPQGVEFALQMSLFPPYPGQRLTLEEFQAGYCLEDETFGHIEVEIDEDRRSVQAEVVIARPSNDQM